MNDHSLLNGTSLAEDCYNTIFFLKSNNEMFSNSIDAMNIFLRNDLEGLSIEVIKSQLASLISRANSLIEANNSDINDLSTLANIVSNLHINGHDVLEGQKVATLNIQHCLERARFFRSFSSNSIYPWEKDYYLCLAKIQDTYAQLWQDIYNEWHGQETLFDKIDYETKHLCLNSTKLKEDPTNWGDDSTSSDTQGDSSDYSELYSFAFTDTTKCNVQICSESINNLYIDGWISLEKKYYLTKLINYYASNNIPISENVKIKDQIKNELLFIDNVQYEIKIFDAINWSITKNEAIELNTILSTYGITSKNSIACFLICCKGEIGSENNNRSGNFITDKYGRAITEEYTSTNIYSFEERGVGYLQVTHKSTQKKCYESLVEKGFISPSLDVGNSYVDELVANPWAVSAWFWSEYKMVGSKSLNKYVCDICNETDSPNYPSIGLVFTAEAFINGKVSGNATGNTILYSTIDDALHYVARDQIQYIPNHEYSELSIKLPYNISSNKNMDSLRETGYWTVESGANNLSYYININGDRFSAPANWDHFEKAYNDLDNKGLIHYEGL